MEALERIEFEARSSAQHGALKDADIRSLLLQAISSVRSSDECLVVNEMNVSMGYSKLDVAVLNGRLEGFEIKSDRDSTARLSRQMSQYEQVCDRLSIITTERHRAAIEELVPAWCGIFIVSVSEGHIRISTWRAPRENPKWDILAVLLLLWQEETLKFAHSLGFKAPRDMAKGLIHNQLARRIPHDQLRAGVLQRLRQRSQRSEN
jgi:hypothetical protein